MPQQKSKSTSSGWAALIAAEMKSREQRPPGSGWKTMPEIREELGLGRCGAYALIRRALAQKRAEKFNGVCEVAGQLRICVWYRLLP